jgi:hypothetical protein
MAAGVGVPRPLRRHTTLPLHNRPEHSHTHRSTPSPPGRSQNLVGQIHIYHTHTIHTHHHRRRRMPNPHPTLHTSHPYSTETHPPMGTQDLIIGRNRKTLPDQRPLPTFIRAISWADPHLRNQIPNTLQTAILYLRKLLQSNFPERLHSLTLTLSKPNSRSAFIANRWLGLLASTLDTLSPGSTSLQLLSSTKQPDVNSCFKKTAERARLAEHTTPTTRQPIHVTRKGSTKRTRPPTKTAADPIPIDASCHYKTPTLTHHTPVVGIIQTCPPKHPRHSTKPSRTTEYTAEFHITTYPFHIAQGQKKEEHLSRKSLYYPYSPSKDL